MLCVEEEENKKKKKKKKKKQKKRKRRRRRRNEEEEEEEEEVGLIEVGEGDCCWMGLKTTLYDSFNSSEPHFTFT